LRDYIDKFDLPSNDTAAHSHLQDAKKLHHPVSDTN